MPEVRGISRKRIERLSIGLRLMRLVLGNLKKENRKCKKVSGLWDRCTYAESQERE